MTSEAAPAPVYLDDDEPEFLRLSRVRLLAAAVPLPLLYLWGAFSPAHYWWVEAIGLSLYVLGLQGVVHLTGRKGLELHRGFLVLQRGWLPSAAAACDIDDIRIERRYRWSSRNMTLVLTNGKRRIARQPGRGEGLLRTNFETDLQRVREWWLANRDLDVVVVQVNQTPVAA